MFSAYDIKKILPRAVFALVAISLSWALMSILINFMGFLGDSIESIILDSFTNASSALTTIKLDGNSGGWFVALAAVAVGSAGLGLVPVVGLIVAAVTGVGIAFVIILLRRVALVALVVLAPLAIAMSVLPQTEKIFKNWWEWFFKLLLMYPFLMAMFAFSRVAAGIFSTTGAGGVTGTLYQFAAIAILIAPYFLVGKAFSFAGGTIAKLAGMVNNKDKGLIDKTKKWEAGKVAERRTDAKAGSRYGGRNFVTRGINRTLRDASSVRKTAFRGQATKQAEILNANAEAAAKLEETRPGVKGATKDEIRIGMTSPNERAAKAAVERFVAEEVAKGGNAAEARAKWTAALAGWKSKAGTLDSAASTWALNKGAEMGVGTAEDIGVGTSLIGQNLGAPGIIGSGAQPGSIGGTLSANLESTWRASGNALGYAPTAETPAQFASLSTTDQASLIGGVDGIFNGDKALSYEGLGKVKVEQARTVRTVKNQQVQTILADVAGGVITREQGEAQLAQHVQHALTMAQAAGDQSNTLAATEAAGIVEDINAAIDAHNSSLPPLPAGVPSRAVSGNTVNDDGYDQAKVRVSPLK